MADDDLEHLIANVAAERQHVRKVNADYERAATNRREAIERFERATYLLERAVAELVDESDPRDPGRPGGYLTN